MPNPVKIMAILAARPGKTDELKALVLGMVAPSRAEPGNLRWDVWQDQADTGRFVLDELYKDNAAVAAHRETPHFKHYLARINDLAERTALVLDPAEVA
jgi:quinol monooxygenase YgiN